jgi:hypothetical protein
MVALQTGELAGGRFGAGLGFGFGRLQTGTTGDFDRDDRTLSPNSGMVQLWTSSTLAAHLHRPVVLAVQALPDGGNVGIISLHFALTGRWDSASAVAAGIAQWVHGV